MRTKLTILAGILAFSGAALQGATSYSLDFNTQSNSPGLVYDGSYAISPYSGAVNDIAVQLYCVDFNDTITFGQQNINVYVTAITADTNTLKAQTRYGVDNPSPNSATYYPSGTTLYEEMAWLATQMMTSTSSTQDKAIQEAMWQLTDASGSPTAPNYSSGNNGTASSGVNGTAQSAANWIQDAYNYVHNYNASTGTSSWSNASKYSALVLSDWSIITAVDAAGCTVGHHDPSGCTPGTSGTGSTTQEFLAYKQGGLVLTTTTGNSSGAVPEPATFVLIGSGLLAGVMIRRRKA